MEIAEELELKELREQVLSLQSQVQLLTEENKRLKTEIQTQDTVLDSFLSILDDISASETLRDDRGEYMLNIMHRLDTPKDIVYKWIKSTGTKPHHMRHYWTSQIRECYSFTPLHCAAINCKGMIPVFDQLLEEAKEDPSLINIQDIVGRTPLFYAARSLNFYAFEKLIEYGASVHILDYSGSNCLQFVTELSSKKDDEKKSEMINRILQLMKEQHLSEYVQRINQGILRVREKHRIATSARDLQYSILIKDQTYFALYAKIHHLDNNQFMLEYQSSFEKIQHVSGDRFPHFQLFKSGLLLLFTSALSRKTEKVALEKVIEDALQEDICAFHKYSDHPEDNPLYSLLKPMVRKDCICTQGGPCALHLLQRLLEKASMYPLTYLYDGSQCGADIMMIEEEDGVKYCLKKAVSND